MFAKFGEGDRLENLQRESWQLELLVTGFALAGMISGASEFSDWVSKNLRSLSGNDIQTSLAGGLLIGSIFAYFITLANFFFHVVLRCLWIGAIGSRSVMGQTILARRSLAPKFDRFLRARSGNFDRYINRLDDAASLIFAFTFLLIFITLSLLTVTLVLSLMGLAIAAVSQAVWASVSLGILVFIILVFALIYLIDFLTAGWMKRFHRFSYVYYPLYRFLGWITLARIYRPLYYNLLNRRGGRVLVLLLVPYLLISLYVISLEITPNKYVAGEYISQDVNSALSIDPHHYQDADPDRRANGEVVIPSEVIRSSPLRVRIPLLQIYEKPIAHLCPDLPKHYESTVHSDLFDGGETGVYKAPDSLQSHEVVLTRKVLDCLTGGFALRLDSTDIALDDVLLTKAKDEDYSDLIKFIPLDSLEAGLHQLSLRQFKVSSRGGRDSIVLRSEVFVPFYYAPE